MNVGRHAVKSVGERYDVAANRLRCFDPLSSGPLEFAPLCGQYPEVVGKFFVEFTIPNDVHQPTQRGAIVGIRDGLPNGIKMIDGKDGHHKPIWKAPETPPKIS